MKPPKPSLAIRFSITLLALITAFVASAIIQKPAFTQSIQQGSAADAMERVEAAIGKGTKNSFPENSTPPVNAGPVKPQEVNTAADYVFSTATNASFTDMSSGTTQLVGPTQDDTASVLTNIGFDFYLLGTRYSQFSTSSNGYVRLGGVVSTTQYTLGTAGVTLIASYGSDEFTSTTGKSHFKVTGSAPNRVLTIEFLNQTIIYDGAGATADGTSQVRLYESTGVVELVYGGMVRNSSTGFMGGLDPQYVGFSTNSTANTFATVNVATNAVNTTGTVTSNAPTLGAPIPNINTPVDGSRRIYSFTPVVPTAPTSLTFTGVTPLAMTLNWADSANELIYAVYRSLDGVNYTFETTLAQNTTSYSATALSPNTNYFWRVFAVSDGAQSTALAGSQMTSGGGAITSTAAGGPWSSTATWNGGVVPGINDNVTITDGATVTVDTAASALSLTVGTGGAGAVLQFDATTARTLTVATSVTIASNGTVQSAATGTVTTHVLSVGTNLTNNGVLDFSTNANTAGAGITFTGPVNNTFSGTGATTDIRAITINKGTSNANILEVTTSNFTVQGVTTDSAGFLTLTNGTFKLSGSFTGTNRVFTAAAYTIGATTGFWLNNPNYTVAGQNGSPTESGLLRITQGTFNIGTATGNSMGFSTGSTITVEGGAVNGTSRFGVAAAANTITYTQTAGTITVNTIGNASTTLGSFDLGTSLNSVISMTGGTVVCQLAASAIDYRNQAGGGIAGVTGGTLQLGNAASGAAKAFSIRGVVPNLVLTNTSANHTASFSTTLVNFNNISLNVTINTGTTLNFGNVVFLFNGTTLTNNGTMTHNGASSNFVWFLATAPQSYTGTGVVTAPMTNFAVQSDMGLTISAASSNIVVGAIRLFSGSVINSNKITLGNGGATTGVVQIGNTTTPTAAGTFDVPFTFNLGTGGQNVSYLRTTASRTTGPEINPTRTLNFMNYDDNDPAHTLTVAGGNLSMTSTGTGTTAALQLTNGRIITGANTLILPNAASVVARTTGVVDGNLRKTYAAAASKTFEVGTANGFSPVTVNVTAGTFPADFTVKAVQGPQPNIADPTKALQRYWTLTGTGVTADLTFNYLDPTDIPGTATEANFFIFKYDGSFTAPGGTVNTAANTATITGVSSFSDWTLAEPAAPTDVNLASFTAESFSGNVNGKVGVSNNVLRWQTGYEAANLGFNVYRDENGSRVRVTPDLVAGSALFVGSRTVLGAGRSYTWRDTQGQAGPDAQYWLEDININGTSTWHGPIRAIATGKQLTAVTQQNSKLIGELNTDSTAQDTSRPVEKAAGFGKMTPARIEAQAAITEQQAVKMSVKQEGWYRVGQPELVAAGFNPNVDPNLLQLFVDGQEQAFSVIQKDGKFDSSSAVEFYGLGMNTAYSDARVYYLVAGAQPGKRITQIKSQAALPATGGFQQTVERRDRGLYFAGLLNGERENFFGAVVARDPIDQSLTLQHLQSTGGQATLEVALQGVTLFPHRIKAQINGIDAGEILFAGQSQGLGRFTIQQSLLREGQNVVRLTPLAGPSDISLVDYIRVTYQHGYTADNNVLRLTATGRQQVTINGFNNNQIRVFDITSVSSVREVIGTIQQQSSGYSVTFTAPETNSRTLLALTNDQAARAAGLALNKPSSLRQPLNGADLLIISRGDFLGGLEPLRDWRQRQGLSVAMVDIEDVYDEFSFGQKTPQALKDFLYYAATTWKKAPRFALLAADASYDPKNYLGLGNADFVPTKLVDTQLMETASDSWLADFNGDGVEDIAIGRLPVRDAQQASFMAAKIIGYDQSAPSGMMLLVADKGDTYDFHSANGRLRALIPSTIKVEEIDRSLMDDFTAKTRLIESIGRGQKIVNYTGHGSVTLWRGNILESEDVASLGNAKSLSLFVTMTCLNGYFADPAVDSLAESLMRADGGAVAVWASTGMTTPEGQALMNQEAYRQLFASGLTLGQAVAKAKAAVVNGDIRQTWILFGDPTSRLR